MASDSDLAAAIAIALLVFVIAMCAWPGFARARSRDLAGYWADADGDLYEIRAGPCGGREFVAQGGRAGAAVRPGRVTGVRGVELSGTGGRKKGQLDLGGRRISWKAGGAWTRQGVPTGASAGAR